MPRRQRGEGSLFQRKSDNMWVGRVDLGWADGKRKRKTVYGRTQAECMRKLNKAKRAVEQGDRTTASMTVERWLDYWLVEVVPHKAKVKPQTIYGYRRLVTVYVNPAIGKVRLDRLAPQHVRQVHRFIQNKGLGLATLGAAHRTLSVALNDAVREGLLVTNPVKLVSAPPPSKSDRRALEVPEARRLFAAIEGDRLASRWHTALLLGLRQGECLGLRWSAVDLHEGVADVNRQLQRVPYRHGCGTVVAKKYPCGRRADFCPDRELAIHPGFHCEVLEGNMVLQTPKTVGSTRVIPLPPPLVATLEHRHALYLEERGQYAVDHDLVWCRLDGRPIDSKTDRAQWTAALKAAGIPHTDQHSARHTTVTLLLALGVPEPVIMSIVGHSQVLTTRGYQHTDLTMQRNAVGKLGTELLLPSAGD